METLKNSKCYIEYRIEAKEVFGKDLTDSYNDPAFYTKSKRGLKQAWKALKTLFNDNTTLHDVIFALREHNIKTHYWCMVD